MLDLNASDNAAAPSQEEIIFDCNADDFEARVIRASMEKPVIADFWAPWCGPCKTLTPALEAAVKAAGGEVLLAKINMDDNQELAAALRIQSVPTVYAFFGGRPVDAFQGNVPESQLKEFITKLVTVARSAKPEALDIPQALNDAAAALAEGDLGQAQGLYAQILQQDQMNAAAYAGLVRTMIAGGALEQAQGLVDNAPEEISKQAAFAEAKTALELALEAPEADYDALQAALDKNPADHGARYDLAQAMFAAGAREEAVDHLLEILTQDRAWNDEAARTQLLKYFEAMGHSDPVTMAGRRKLSSLLFS